MREPLIRPAAEQAPAFAAMAKRLGWQEVIVVGGASFSGKDVRVRVVAEVTGNPQPDAYYVPKDMDACRRALEQEGCAGITGWWKGGGINYVLAKLAAENAVPIMFEFAPLLREARRGRMAVFAAMSEGARYVRKYRAPVLVASGAQDPWEMRSPSDLLSFGRVLGLEDAQIKAGWKA